MLTSGITGDETTTAQGLFAPGSEKELFASWGTSKVCFVPAESDGIIEICSNEVVTEVNAQMSEGKVRVLS